MGIQDGQEIILSRNSTGVGQEFKIGVNRPNRTWQASIAGTGAVSATVLVQVSNDGTNWLTLVTFALSGTTTDQAGETTQAPWAYTRANVTAISGTGAVVTVTMGV
jgi:hypothetical protein